MVLRRMKIPSKMLFRLSPGSGSRGNSAISKDCSKSSVNLVQYIHCLPHPSSSSSSHHDGFVLPSSSFPPPYLSHQPKNQKQKKKATLPIKISKDVQTSKRRLHDVQHRFKSNKDKTSFVILKFLFPQKSPQQSPH